MFVCVRVTVRVLVLHMALRSTLLFDARDLFTM